MVSKTLVGDAPATRDTDPSKVVATSFLVDPATGASQEIASPAWRPVVDPTDRRVAWWQGTFRWSAAEQSWTPDRGQIVIGDWSALQDGTVNSPEALPWSAPIVDGATWDVRWDPSGRRLAVWISDGPGELSGRLSLFAVQADGSLGAAVVKQAAALAAFSLDAERLAWATPPGKDGAGSTLSVYAWTDNGDGNLRSAPNPDGSIVVAP